MGIVIIKFDILCKTQSTMPAIQQVDLKVIGDKSDCDGNKSNDSSSSVVNTAVGVNSSSRKNPSAET